MRKNKLTLITSVFMLCIVLVSFVNAATVSSVKYEDSKITISGTSTGNQVQVVIFNEKKEPIYMGTVEVKDKKYEKTLDAKFDLDDGKFIVKTADYDGSNVTEKTFTVEDALDNTPKTGY